MAQQQASIETEVPQLKNGPAKYVRKTSHGVRLRDLFSKATAIAQLGTAILMIAALKTVRATAAIDSGN